MDEVDCMLNIPSSSAMTNSLDGVYIKKSNKYRPYQPVNEGFHKQDSCKDAIQATSRVTQPKKKDIIYLLSV